MGKIYQKYINEFSCLAGECPDTCCAGWQIYIDGQSAKDYLADNGEIGCTARKYMRGKPDNSRLALVDKRCPFLTEDNLCRIVQLKGQHALSTVCSMHPRFVHPLFEDEFIFLSLSCPRAVSIFFSAIKNGGVHYGYEDLKNPYLSQFLEYVSEICEQLRRKNTVIDEYLTHCDTSRFSALVSDIFARCEYLEKQTGSALKNFDVAGFIAGYNKLEGEYGTDAFCDLFRYYALTLYDEKSPVLPVAYLFTVATCYLVSVFSDEEKAVYKFVKETEHSAKNIRSAIRIMRSPKAENIMSDLALFNLLYSK